MIIFVSLFYFRSINPMFEGSFQHDAQELLRCLLCYMEDSEKELRQVNVKRAEELRCNPCSQEIQQIEQTGEPDICINLDEKNCLESCTFIEQTRKTSNDHSSLSVSNVSVFQKNVPKEGADKKKIENRPNIRIVNASRKRPRAETTPASKKEVCGKCNKSKYVKKQSRRLKKSVVKEICSCTYDEVICRSPEHSMLQSDEQKPFSRDLDKTNDTVFEDGNSDEGKKLERNTCTEDKKIGINSKRMKTKHTSSNQNTITSMFGRIKRLGIRGRPTAPKSIRTVDDSSEINFKDVNIFSTSPVKKECPSGRKERNGCLPMELESSSQQSPSRIKMTRSPHPGGDASVHSPSKSNSIFSTSPVKNEPRNERNGCVPMETSAQQSPSRIKLTSSPLPGGDVTVHSPSKSNMKQGKGSSQLLSFYGKQSRSTPSSPVGKLCTKFVSCHSETKLSQMGAFSITHALSKLNPANVPGKHSVVRKISFQDKSFDVSVSVERCDHLLQGRGDGRINVKSMQRKGRGSLKYNGSKDFLKMKGNHTSILLGDQM